MLAVVDSAGTVQQSYAYDVFGAVTQQSGSTGNEQQFAGQQTDPDGLQFLRARFYDPTTGRFLSRDAWSVADKTIFQPYVYARNNPMTATDPSGHCVGVGDLDPEDPNNADCPGMINGQMAETTASSNPTQAEIDAANAEVAEAAVDAALDDEAQADDAAFQSDPDAAARAAAVAAATEQAHELGYPVNDSGPIKAWEPHALDSALGNNTGPGRAGQYVGPVKVWDAITDPAKIVITPDKYRPGEFITSYVGPGPDGAYVSVREDGTVIGVQPAGRRDYR